MKRIADNEPRFHTIINKDEILAAYSKKNLKWYRPDTWTFNVRTYKNGSCEMNDCLYRIKTKEIDCFLFLASMLIYIQNKNAPEFKLLLLEAINENLPTCNVDPNSLYLMDILIVILREKKILKTRALTILLSKLIGAAKLTHYDINVSLNYNIKRFDQYSLLDGSCDDLYKQIKTNVEDLSNYYGKCLDPECDLCTICMSNRNDVAIVSCGHIFCSKCYNNIISNNVIGNNVIKCPTCRHPINGYQKIYK